MKRRLLYLGCGILILLSIGGYWRYRQYPLPNLPAQQKSARCASFFGTHPNLGSTKKFLQSEKIDFQQESHADLFLGNTASDFQKAHRKSLKTVILFRIYGTKTPFCGMTDDLFIVSFGQREQLLKAEQIESNYGCFDF
ncbi:hypothetical protein [Abditibacterium utsteinense]|uniref:hypothetical protein n=1 Tax=Abditibacterium utsteinense TaxID=1960156 RepID=UPI000F49526A|nr:hypothetical protein [Abditibacterium utsteinense]